MTLAITAITAAILGAITDRAWLTWTIHKSNSRRTR